MAAETVELHKLKVLAGPPRAPAARRGRAGAAAAPRPRSPGGSPEGARLVQGLRHAPLPRTRGLPSPGSRAPAAARDRRCGLGRSRDPAARGGLGTAGSWSAAAARRGPSRLLRKRFIWTVGALFRFLTRSCLAQLAELKQECLARGLEAKGNKQDLIQRLQAYLEEHGGCQALLAGPW